MKVARRRLPEALKFGEQLDEFAAYARCCGQALRVPDRGGSWRR